MSALQDAETYAMLSSARLQLRAENSQGQLVVAHLWPRSALLNLARQFHDGFMVPASHKQPDSSSDMLSALVEGNLQAAMRVCQLHSSKALKS